MKTAGIARAVVLAMTLTFVGLLTAGPVGAAPLSKQLNGETYGLAVDGSDVYWAVARLSKHGRQSWTVYRGSFLNNSRTVIARYPGSWYGDIRGLSAGGGYVVLSLNTESSAGSDKNGTPTTEVLRISRDGSRRDVIATGRIVTEGFDWFVKNGVPYLNDCGTRVHAIGVSASGSVAIASAKSDRRSKSCGRKKDVDHWRYYEQRLDGSQREIFAKSQAIRTTFKRIGRGGRGGYGFSSTSGVSALKRVQLVGDRALFRPSESSPYFLPNESSPYYVRDLASGTLSGPLSSAKRARERLEIASLSPNGAVTLNSFLFRNGAPSAEIGIFPNAANPAIFLKRKSKTPLLYCGSRLLSVPDNGKGKLQELDPVSFTPIRTLANRLPSSVTVLETELGCNNDYLYATDSRGDTFSYLAYPLS